MANICCGTERQIGDSLSKGPQGIFPRRLERLSSMLAIVISLLFGLTASAALAVIHASVTTGARRARFILAELAEFERAERAPVVTPRFARPAAPLALAAA
jgi:hypothetical protein